MALAVKLRKLIQSDLDIISASAPDVVILEISTNDLSVNRLEVVGSDIKEFVHVVRETSAVKVIGVCEVIPRGARLPQASNFNRAVPVFND